MSVEQRSFSGKTLRPTPEVHVEADTSFGAIVTPWGTRAGVKRVVESLSDFILSSKNDIENTSPFKIMTCLSPLANTLRSAVMLANDVMYREENKNEYQNGVELFAFSRSANELSYVQIGQPHVILHRKSMPLIPLSLQMDLGMEWSTAKLKLPPLPHDLLGLHGTSNFHVVSFRPMPGDELILLSRSHLPNAVLQAAPADRNIDGLSRILAADDAEQPFWLGIIALSAKAATGEEAA